AGRVHMARQAVDLGTGISRPADPGEPGRTSAQYRRYDRDSLYIVNCAWTAIETSLRRKWRLEPWLALASLEALEKPGLVAANIGARAAMQMECEIIPRTAGVLADQLGIIRLVDGRLEPLRLVVELATNIDVAMVDTHPDRGEQTTLNQLMGFVA